MARHGTLRAHPHELLLDTLCVVSVWMNYLPANAVLISTLKNSKLGYVSRYALDRDYHKLLCSRPKELGEMVQQHYVSLNFRLFVDSAPILGRPLAEKAGLGWMGRYSLILNREAGSFFFLGELLVSTPPPVDQPAEEGCGKYVACMTICPTGAIVEPYTADARRCISYLTIEPEGAILEELQLLMGNRIYGCDDCQLICPWSHYPQPTTEENLSPHKPLHAPELIELFARSEEGFLKVAGGSTIHCTGHLCWLHSIAVALGNAPRDEMILITLESRKGEYPFLDEYIV